MIELKLQKILNRTDYRRFEELLHLFNEDNQHWMLHFLNNFLDYPGYNDRWSIFKDEPDEYITISEEIFDIVDGFVCIVKRLGHNADWDAYGLEGINQK